MPDRESLAFSSPDVFTVLSAMSDAERDALGFGVIGFDADTVVRQYNTFECEAAGLGMARVVGQPLFTVVAPCMNNFMVAQRFDDALETGEALDATIDYVLTLRMRPVKVALRLLSAPGAALRYVLVQRN